MTPITLPRAVVEQALEALKGVVSAHSYQSGTPVDAITALRAALAQQAEPVEPEPAPMPPFPPVSQWNRGCAACGAHGNATGYVCPRSDCPTKVTCGGVA